jgi:hypothetical protein
MPKTKTKEKENRGGTRKGSGPPFKDADDKRGKVMTLRVYDWLHQRCKEEAASQNISMTQYVIECVARDLGIENIPTTRKVSNSSPGKGSGLEINNDLPVVTENLATTGEPTASSNVLEIQRRVKLLRQNFNNSIAAV